MDEDSGAVAARWREGLTRQVARAYEAAHGNPIPERHRGSRWRLEPRVAVSLLLAVALLSLVTYWSLRPAQVTAMPLAVEPSATVVVNNVVVHVAGAVNHPGLVTLNAGSRVADAIDLAGGMVLSADPASINLARPVIDGEQIYVPVVGEAPSSRKVNLNRADASELDALPGIGPVLAERIVADREANGPFASVDDLARVSGVGASVVEQIAPLATV
jgi:competence protein ComEA